MAEETLVLDHLTKEEKYKAIVPQIESLVEHEQDLIANLANICAVFKHSMGFFWVGFYLDKEGQLVLGPFQGTLACTRIPYNKGVCGASYSQKKTIVVPDVEAFPGHIACSSQSRSEIVVPVLIHGKVAMVLDVDSDQLAEFDETDQFYLEQVAHIIATLFP